MFTKEYLEYCKKLSPYQILQFLDEFRKLYGVRHVTNVLEEKKKTK